MHTKSYLKFALIINLIAAFIFTAKTDAASDKKDTKQTSCDFCKELVDKFMQRMNETINKNYESGSIDWVRKNLGKYEDSETRYISVIENICKDFNKKHKCKSFVEKYEESFEHWFMHERKENVTLFNFMCIAKAEECCPPFHYGKNCSICPGYKDGVMCSGHGTCNKEGARKGNGSCSCSMGYDGEFCENCAVDFYKSVDGACLPCHKSCTGPCVNHTLEGCLGSCKEGWKVDDEGKCQDINECSLNTHNCKEGQRCLNVPGKFYCMACHENCLTCNGDEEDRCITCKSGYVKNDKNQCIDIDECLEGQYKCKKMTYCLNKLGGYKCRKCHIACTEGCDGPKMDDCIACNKGFKLKENGQGCEDINECQDDKVCSEGKYCLNKEGSYKCKKCHEACSLCHGPGPYSCFACSDGYKMVKGLCMDPSKIKQVEDAENEEDL